MHSLASRGLRFLFLLAMGCANASPPSAALLPAREVRGASDLTLEVRVAMRSAPGLRWRDVAPADALHHGDQIQLRVRTDRPAYLYVIHDSQSDGARLLFSGAGHGRIEPNRTISVPAGAATLELVADQADQILSETLYVVASHLPLNQADCERLGIPDLAAPLQRGPQSEPRPKTASPPAERPPPPPKETKPIGERPLHIQEGPRFIRRVQADRSGLALLSIRLSHSARP